MSHSHVFEPEAVDLMGRAMKMADTLCLPLHMNETTRRQMARMILRAVEHGETDTRKIAEFAAAQGRLCEQWRSSTQDTPLLRPV